LKILVLADYESKFLYEYFKPEKIKDIDLIISCGDLRSNYLTFFATFSHAPVFYVRGNHDCQYKVSPPEGCTCIEDDIVIYKGIRILGLGGSMEYIPGADNQYTERMMEKRIRHLWWKLKKNNGFDILVTHAPAYKLNDLPDLPHKGFMCFKKLLDKYVPKFFLHGHIHANYGAGFKRIDQYGSTTVINGYESYVFEYPD
jgi:Icc-related predicted phosphoesterase